MVDPDSIGMVNIDREAALKVDVRQCMVRLNKMSKDLQAIMHLQAQHKNEKRRREDSDTESDRKRPAPFTPPKRGCTLVHDSYFDDADVDPDEYDEDRDPEHHGLLDPVHFEYVNASGNTLTLFYFVSKGHAPCGEAGTVLILQHQSRQLH